MSHANGEAGAPELTGTAGQVGNSPKRDLIHSKTKPDGSTLLQSVAELWPIFTVDSFDVHKPLAVGVDKQLLGLLKGHEINVLLKYYTRRRMYLAALAAGGSRFNLDGSAAGDIAPEHVEGARALLAHMDTKQAELAAAAAAVRQAGRDKRRAERELEQAEAGASSLRLAEPPGSSQRRPRARRPITME